MELLCGFLKSAARGPLGAPGNVQSCWPPETMDRFSSLLMNLLKTPKVMHCFLTDVSGRAERRMMRFSSRFCHACVIWHPGCEFRGCLSQGQAKNELPNCWQYFLFGSISPKALPRELPCEKANACVSHRAARSLKGSQPLFLLQLCCAL